MIFVEMTSESEGESDAQIAECQNPTCKAKGPKEEVRGGIFPNGTLIPLV